MTNFKICSSLFSPTKQISQNVHIVQWSVSYFQFLQVLGWNICGNIFPVGADESEQTSDTVWEFYWMHNNLLTIATKLHIRSGRRMRFVSKTWKLQLDTAIYEYGIYYVMCPSILMILWRINARDLLYLLEKTTQFDCGKLTEEKEMSDNTERPNLLLALIGFYLLGVWLK